MCLVEMIFIKKCSYEVCSELLRRTKRLAKWVGVCCELPYEEVAPEKAVVISEEVVVNPTAVSLTTIIDEYIALSSAILFAHDDAELSEDGKAIIDERIAKYHGY